MKKNIIIIFCTLISLAIIVASCSKIDIPNSNTITVNFINKGSGYVTENITVDPGASIAFNYSITSPTDMEFVYITKNGTEISKDQLTTNKTSFTGDKSFTADLAPGVYTYRFLAKDKGGIYLGEKNIVITVNNNTNFNYYTVKTLFVPDTVAKSNPTYYSTSTNEVLSYNNIGSKSGLIDFGYFYDPTLAGTPATANGHTIYALNITPIPSAISIYDISTFTKNATVFKRVTTPTFANVTSSSVLQAAGVANLGSGTSTSINKLLTGNTILFKTAAGKYGMIQVNYSNQDSPSKGTFINLDVKIQK